MFIAVQHRASLLIDFYTYTTYTAGSEAPFLRRQSSITQGSFSMVMNYVEVPIIIYLKLLHHFITGTIYSSIKGYKEPRLS